MGGLAEWAEPLEALLRDEFRRPTIILDITGVPVAPDGNGNDHFF